MCWFKLTAICLLSFAAVSIGVAGGALGSAGAARGVTGTELSNFELAGSALVVPASETLLGGEQVVAQQRATLADPTAVASRRASRTRFEHLDAQAAVRLAGETFPRIVNAPAGGPPPLLGGARFAGYVGSNAERIALPGGRHGVLESLQPIALRTGTDRFAPIDLSLREAGGGYSPTFSDETVQIPKRLSDGVATPLDGVSLTPADGHGRSLNGSQGVLGGASVLYANVLSDTDMLAKPTTGGFQLDALLRSVQSPQTLYFKVGLPAGAQLVADPRGHGARVVLGGQTIALVSAPSARDADGIAVPLQTSVHGDMLAVSLQLGADEYRYPIEVDPNVFDSTVLAPRGGATNWHFWTPDPGKFESYNSLGIVMAEKGNYKDGESDALIYTSYGYAHVISIEEESEAGVSSVSGVVTKLEIAHGSTQENERVLAGAGQGYSRTYSSLCVPKNASTCGEGAIINENAALFTQTVTALQENTEAYGFWAELDTATVGVDQEYAPRAHFNTSEANLKEESGRQNVLYGSGGWLGTHNGGFEINTEDLGVGVSDAKVRTVSYGSWAFNESLIGSNLCAGIWCQKNFNQHFIYETGMEEGENQLEVCAEDAAHLTGCGTATVKVDNLKPREIKLKEMAETGAELSATPHQVTVEATDGSGAVPSSGIKSIAVFVDGTEIGSPTGYCSPGECTASGTWTISGEKLGTGVHKLLVKATDNANNILEKEYTFAIRQATARQMGPGTVDPITGQFTLRSSDVDLTGVGGVSRTYRSRALTAGSEGPLGPQWSVSVGAGMSLNVLGGGNVELHSSSGSAITFANEGGRFTAPKGDENWGLEGKENEVGKGITEYLLKNPTADVTDRFTLPSGSHVWVLKSAEGAAPAETTNYGYQTAEAGTEHPITEPTEVLGPVPSGVSCGKNPQEVKLEELKAGCRALSFTYATSTTATEENASGWGEYKNRLAKISFTAYNPSSKAMQTTVVAQYSYDTQGRLRAEWDPRISPALKTTYGYDAEGHVTAMSQPGQEPWLVRYGAISGDAGTGRALSVTRPLASVALGNGNVPVNTAQPTLSTPFPTVGSTMSVSSNGTWSNGPLTYGYQWERCESNCVPLPGAVNQSYTPQPSDAGHYLRASVIATNAAGTVTATTSNTLSVPLSEPAWASNITGSLSAPQSEAVAANGNVWVPNWGENRIDEFSSGGTFIEAVGWGMHEPHHPVFEICTEVCGAGVSGQGNGQFYHPWGIAINPATGNLYVSDESNGRIQELNEKGEFIRLFSSHGTLAGELGAPTGLAVDPGGNLWVADPEDDRVVEFTSAGQYMNQFGVAGSGSGQMAGPYSVAIAGGNLYVAEYTNSRVQEFTMQGTYVRAWGGKGGGSGHFEFEIPAGIGADPVTGDLFVTDCNKNRTEVFTQTGAYVTTFGSAGSGNNQFYCPVDVAFDPTGHAYIADSGHNRIQKWNPTYSTNNPVPAPPSAGSNSISTIEYRVPLSGAGAPYQMTSGELAKWAQTSDRPTEATAIFPPDEPMGWPAADYKRASVIYTDAQARTVNVTAPSGGISTVEYNAFNEITRELSAANRATALKEGAKSAEVAEALSTKKVYSSDGTQVLETYGPEHKIALPGGGEEETRDRQKFSYNEGKPSEESYDLLTKSESWSETASKKVLEKHETKTSYAGAGNIGWKLRKPTLVISEVKGQTTADAVTYNATTGEATESTTSTSIGAPVYTAQFGSSGTGTGQFKTPSGAAVDASGNVWVVDRGNNRVEEFTPLGQFVAAYGSEGTGALQFKAPEAVAVNQTNGNVYVSDSGNNRVEVLSSAGAFLATYGFGVSNGESVFQTCTSGCRAGLSGSGNGEFNAPTGVAVDASGDVWVVDRGNSRVEEFSSGNSYTSKFGSGGTAEGQFKEPAYIAISGGNLYITDSGNARVEEFSSAGIYLSQFGAPGAGAGQFGTPKGIASNPRTGALYVVDSANSRVEQFSEAGAYVSQFATVGSAPGQLKEPVGIAVGASGQIDVVDSGNSRVQAWEPRTAVPVFTSQFGSKGSGNGQLNEPRGVAAGPSGNVDVLDEANSRVEEFSSTGGYVAQFGAAGTGNGQFKSPFGIATDSKNNVWVADTGNNRVQKFNAAHEWSMSIGSAGTGAGQFKEPKAVTVAPNGNVYVSDSANNRIQEFNEKGEFVAAFGYGVSNGEAKYQVCTSGCRAGLAGSEPGEMNSPRGLAVDSHGYLWVADVYNNRVQEFGEHNEYLSQFGSKGAGNGQFSEPKGVAIDTAGNLWVSDAINNRVQEFTRAGLFVAKFGDKGSGNSQFEEPFALGFSTSGLLYVVDYKNNRIEQWTLAPNPGNEGANNTKTTYYSASSNSEYPSCGSHPDWTNLVCQTEPTVQPGSSAPALPVTTTTYNIWDEPEVVTEKIGSVTRTIKMTWDGAGRETASEETSTSSENAAMLPVTFEYSSENGALIKQSESVEGKERTIASSYDKLGHLVSYTDAGGSTTKYVYDVDGRIEEVSEPKGRQVYSYDPTTGFMTKLLDTAAGTFTASYDVAGHMLTEGYPNGMSARYAYNSIEQTTGLEYEKTTHCTEKCVWFSDTKTFGPTGHVASQTSTLSAETYTYNEYGQLAETRETPAGGKCVARVYGYNEENGQREGMTTREECATEGGVVEGHFYDATGRLIDPGVSYDALGNIKFMPSIDAGGTSITSSFYVDNQVSTQKQGEKSVEYSYDPVGRTLVSRLKGPTGSTTSFMHYAGSGNSLTWACEETGECKEEREAKWTRNIPGIDGSLDAIQTNGETPVLQLHDLQGNIVATALLSETATGLLTTHNSIEFGMSSGVVPKYAWLGAADQASEFGTGVVTTAGETYVPQVAQTLQTEAPIPPGSSGGDAALNETSVTAKDIEAVNAGAARTIAEQRAMEAEVVLGEGEDPLRHLRVWEAKNIAAEIAKVLHDITTADLGNSLHDIIDAMEKAGAISSLLGLTAGAVDAVAGTLFSLFTADVAIKWFEAVQAELEFCVSYLHERHETHGGCRFAYTGIFGSDVPWFYDEPLISVCEGMSSDTKVVKWCYLISYLSETERPRMA